jgi:hypothetical protein
LPPHSTQIGSSIAEDAHYDQIAFFPGPTQDQFTGNSGVFDYDGGLFRALYRNRGLKDFLAYCRYYVSDHRPLWPSSGSRQAHPRSCRCRRPSNAGPAPPA